MGGGAGGGTMHVDLPMIQLTTSSSSTPLSIASSPSSSSSLNFPVSVNDAAPLTLRCCTASRCCCPSGVCTRLESERGKDYGRTKYNDMFGPVPAPIEVESAVASLQNFVRGMSSSGSESDRLQQMLDCSNVTKLLSRAYGRVRDAFNLLQTDPSIKRLVISLSSDKAVWDAVMNNEAVRELQQSGKKFRIQSNEEPDITKRVLDWIIDMTKARVGELIQKFQSLINDVFQPLERDKRRETGETDEMDDKVRSSLLLSIVILFIVVVARSYSP